MECNGQNTGADKKLLLQQAVRLASLGCEVENARDKLRKLAEKSMRFDTDEMVSALSKFEKLDLEWRVLESEHLKLRLKMGL